MPPLPTTEEGTTLFLDVSQEEEAEEVERVDALLQRKKLLRDLGVVKQVYKLLNGGHLQPDPPQHQHGQVDFALHKTHDSLNKV